MLNTILSEYVSSTGYGVVFDAYETVRWNAIETVD